MVAHLAEAVGDTQSAVRAAKYCHRPRPEPLLLRLSRAPLPGLLAAAQAARDGLPARASRARRRSSTRSSVSGAGAKGLLQVMTVTAKHVCRDYKIKCDIRQPADGPVLQYHARVGLYRATAWTSSPAPTF